MPVAGRVRRKSNAFRGKPVPSIRRPSPCGRQGVPRTWFPEGLLNTGYCSAAELPLCSLVHIAPRRRRMMQNRIFVCTTEWATLTTEHVRLARRWKSGVLMGTRENLRDDAGRSNDSPTVRATRRRRRSPSPPSPESTLFCLSCVRHSVCSQKGHVLWTRERRRVRGAVARFRRCAVSRGQATLSRSSCARSAGTRHLSQAVEPPRRDPYYSRVTC